MIFYLFFFCSFHCFFWEGGGRQLDSILRPMLIMTCQAISDIACSIYKNQLRNKEGVLLQWQTKTMRSICMKYT